MKIRVADYIVKFLENKSIKHAFMVTGGGAMFLNDGIAKSKKIQGIFNHHEQASSMAALGYSKVDNDIVVVMPTTGCGGTNTITGLLDAWQDSNKVVFISGNVKYKETTHEMDLPLRKLGVQEANIISIVKPITKFAKMINNPLDTKKVLEEAFFECENGRPGPVWIDIPMDIQAALIEEDELIGFIKNTPKKEKPNFSVVEKYLEKSKRPIILAGYGIHLSNTREKFIDFLEKSKIPSVFTYGGTDLVPYEHNLHIGKIGIKGDRPGNFALQNADLIIVLGSSLNIPVIGYEYELFGRNSKIICVDIDEFEHKKKTIRPNEIINCHLDDFFNFFNNKIKNKADEKWIKKCNEWKLKWPVFQNIYLDTSKGINMYLILEKINEFSGENTIVVSDAGSSLYVTSQAIKIKKNQKHIASLAQADMGFTLPCSIGASIKKPESNIIGITGDGSFQMNIQELQTIVSYNLNIKTFVLNNGGYLSIRNTIDKFFEGRHLGTDKQTGLDFPDLEKISNAYGVKFFRLKNLNNINDHLKGILNYNGPALIEVICPFKQEIIPTLSSKEDENGILVSQPLDNMYPFLKEKEYLKEMINKPFK
jgi:acetolactate synthase I/II/III large subunit